MPLGSARPTGKLLRSWERTYEASRPQQAAGRAGGAAVVTTPRRPVQRHTRRASNDGPNLAATIEAYMSARSISTIGDMAAFLGVDRTLVSKYLTGSRRCHDIAQLRHFAQVMDLSPETFGLVANARRNQRADRGQPGGLSAIETRVSGKRSCRRPLG
jgi:hypothetical protein